jgi:hypothetical protein
MQKGFLWKGLVDMEEKVKRLTFLLIKNVREDKKYGR